MGGGKKEENTTVVQVQQTAVQNQETNINTVKDLQGTINGLLDILDTQAQNPVKPNFSSYTVPVILNQQPNAPSASPANSYVVPVILNSPPQPVPPPAPAPPSIILFQQPAPAPQPEPTPPPQVSNTTAPGQTEYDNSQLKSLLATMYLQLIGGEPTTAQETAPPRTNTMSLMLMAAIVILAIYYFRR